MSNLDSRPRLATALGRKPPLLHVIVGPRQVGKTTAAEQLIERLGWPSVYAAADSPLPPGPEWIETQWRLARLRNPGRAGKVLLVLDEVQKVAGWSETIKRLWDEERRTRGPVLAVLLGLKAQSWLIGGGGVPLTEFFARPATDWFK